MNDERINIIVHNFTADMNYINRQADQQFQVTSLYETLGESVKFCAEVVECWDQDASRLERKVQQLQKRLWTDQYTDLDLNAIDADGHSTIDIGDIGIIKCPKCLNQVPKKDNIHSTNCFANIKRDKDRDSMQIVMNDSNKQQNCPSSINIEFSNGCHVDLQTANLSICNRMSSKHMLGTEYGSENEEWLSTRKLNIRNELKSHHIHRRNWFKERAALVSQVEIMNHYALHSTTHEINKIENTMTKRNNSNYIDSTFVHGSLQLLEPETLKLDLYSQLDYYQQRICSMQTRIQIGDHRDEAVVEKMVCSFTSMRHLRSLERLQRIIVDDYDVLVRSALHGWKDRASRRRKCKSMIRHINNILNTQLLRAALHKIMLIKARKNLDKNDKAVLEGSNDSASGLGSYLLEDIKQERSSVLENAHELIDQLISTVVRHELSSSELSLRTQRTNEFWPPLSTIFIKCIQKSNLYLQAGEHHKAILPLKLALDQVLEWKEMNCGISHPVKIPQLICNLHMKIIECYIKVEKNYAAVIFLEQMISFLESVSVQDMSNRDAFKMIVSYSIEQASLLLAEDLISRASLLYKKHFAAEQANEQNQPCKDDFDIQSIRETLHGMSLKLCHIPHLSGATVSDLPYDSTAHHILIKKKFKLQTERDSIDKTCNQRHTYQSELLERQKRLKDELCVASLQKAGKLKSKLIHEEQEILVDVRELRDRLNVMACAIDDQLGQLQTVEKTQITEMKNLDEEIRKIDREIQFEKSQLLKWCKRKQVRCAKIHMIPSRFGIIALSVDKEILLYDHQSSELKTVFCGDDQNDLAREEIHGHLLSITCLDIGYSFVFSGSLDSYVICWDIENNKLNYVAKGHEGTVTCIRVDERNNNWISSSLDMNIIIWNYADGKILFRMRGHQSGITSIDFSSQLYISGDASGSILVWSKDFNCRHNIRASVKGKITVIKSSQYDIAYGDSFGRVTIRRVDKDQSMIQNKVHASSVVDLYLDAVRCISCGNDGFLRVLDRFSDQVVFSYSSHGVPFLSLHVSISDITLTIYVISKNWEVHRLPLVHKATILLGAGKLDQGHRQVYSDTMLSSRLFAK